jgi:SAM-dependent methyltransferase
MKGRESGMPECQQWESFFDPEQVVEALRCAALPGDIVEFGCGFGTFTLPVARRTSGVVHALDIDPEMISHVAAASLTNIVPIERDFIADGTGLPDASAVHAMVFNILHVEDPVGILREACRVLIPGGTVSIIHWRSDLKTPRGPSLEIRPLPEQCLSWAAEAGLVRGRIIELGPSSPWHYGLLTDKPEWYLDLEVLPSPEDRVNS